jgi:hypothetical protein
VNLSVSGYIADSFGGLLPPVRRFGVSTALIEQHSEQQFGCGEVVISGFCFGICVPRLFTAAILPQ